MPAATHPELTEDQIQLIARALSDPRRYEILKKLSTQSCATPCTDIRECIDISPATLSHHMKELETAGLIRSEKEGKFVNYFAQPHLLHAYINRLKSDLACHSVFT
jgi:ArsR family transcriptional regulator, arsenate/arsenite/antimonite-responsive transcriptional repressor